MFDDYIAAFMNTYNYDDEDDFEDEDLKEIIEEYIDDCESDDVIPTEKEMADVVRDALYSIQYGDTCDCGDLERINDDYFDRFPYGR